MWLIRALGFALILLCWELNWRRYPARTAMRWAFYYVVFCGAVGGLALLLFNVAVWRMLAIAAFSWFCGGWTRKLFGAGRPYSWRLPSLAD